MSINKKRAKVTSLSMPRDKVIKGNHYTVTDFLEILQCSEFMAHVFRKTKWHWIREHLSSCIVLEGNTYKIPADTSLCCLSLEGSVCMFVSCCLYNTGYTTAVYNTTYFTVKKKKKKLFSPGKGSWRSILHFVHLCTCWPSPQRRHKTYSQAFLGQAHFRVCPRFSFSQSISNTSAGTPTLFFFTLLLKTFS